MKKGQFFQCFHLEKMFKIMVIITLIKSIVPNGANTVRFFLLDVISSGRLLKGRLKRLLPAAGQILRKL